MTSSLSRAGQWFLSSGIQEPSGGVARYYRADLGHNQPVSTEITGYAVSTLFYLYNATGEDAYCDHALRSAHFLCREAWDGHRLPFEIQAAGAGRFSYFFDCGIVVRGLLAAWRSTQDPEFLDVATAIAQAMADDFADDDGGYYPIVTLPRKQPVEIDPTRWSRMRGCYQLKSALAWSDLYEATGESRFAALYGRALENSLRHYGSFLPGHRDRLRVVDRLHAFVYFLEGLLPHARERHCAAALCHGIGLVAEHCHAIAPEFERSDVYAQLLRIRLHAHWAGVTPLDAVAAAHEVSALAAFQTESLDPRIDGGFYFGRQGQNWLPHINPVSTAFALQAIALWEQHQRGSAPELPRLLI